MGFEMYLFKWILVAATFSFAAAQVFFPGQRNTQEVNNNNNNNTQPANVVTQLLQLIRIANGQTGVCPDISTPLNYVCQNCDNIGAADVWMGANAKSDAVSPSLLFAGKTFEKTPISYTPIGTSTTKCTIKERVQAWLCTTNSKGDWRCSPQGFCTAEVEKNGAVYKPARPITCTCPNPDFERKHVCSWCTNPLQALEFVNRIKPNRKKPRNRGIFSGPFTYNEVTVQNEKMCNVNTPPEVLSWECILTTDGKQFDRCEDKGFCTNLMSKLIDGHFAFDSKICYKVHPNKEWDDNCATLSTLVVSTAASCMRECKMDTTNECNAFNYKRGRPCILKRCPNPYPTPVASEYNYGAFYYVPN